MERIPFLGSTTLISSTGKSSVILEKIMFLTGHRIVVLGLLILDHFTRAHQIFERDFSLNDPLIQHPHTSEQWCLFITFALSWPLTRIGYKNIRFHKRSDCWSCASFACYLHRRIQKLNTRNSPWFACSNRWQVRHVTREDVYRANHLIAP